MLDADALIEPGRGLGGLQIRYPVDALLLVEDAVRVIELPGDDENPDGVTIHSFGAIRTWSVDGSIVQVGAFEGYRGKTAAGIGVGSTIEEIRAAYGDVVPMGGEGMLRVPSVPGVGIETTEWATADQPDPAARVVQIFVHSVNA